jgi:dienelactone hydrolase
VNIARKFEYAVWTRYGTEQKTTTLFGWARELSRRGYVTLSITQRGLDNRQPDTEARNKALLVHGRNVMGTIVYEIRQGLTYLRQRPEVDPEKIGRTGISFGGITTFYTWLTDDRIAAAAPICGGIGSVEEFIKHGARGYHGSYWWVPGLLSKGDHGDFVAAMAPRPLMLWAPRNDIGMPNAGIDRFLERAVPAFKQVGAADRLVIHRPPGEHAMTMEAFEAMFQFFGLCARIRRTGGLMGFRWHGGFRYTAWFEKQRLDKDSGLAGLPGVSERDRRTGQDAETMGAAEVWQVGLLRVRPERARDRRSL